MQQPKFKIGDRVRAKRYVVKVDGKEVDGPEGEIVSIGYLYSFVGDSQVEGEYEEYSQEDYQAGISSDLRGIMYKIGYVEDTKRLKTAYLLESIDEEEFIELMEES